jgi:hypothetical protein
MGLRALLAVTALHAPLRAVVAHRAYPTDHLRRNPQSARVAADYGYGLRRCADFTAPPRSDDAGMSLIERSPGGFVFVANVVLYATVLLETLMLVTGSPLFMVGVLALIVAVAGLLCRFILNLMGTEAYTLGEEEPETAAPAPRPADPAVAPAPQRRPARVVAGAPVLH